MEEYRIPITYTFDMMTGGMRPKHLLSLRDLKFLQNSAIVAQSVAINEGDRQFYTGITWALELVLKHSLCASNERIAEELRQARLRDERQLEEEDEE